MFTLKEKDWFLVFGVKRAGWLQFPEHPSS